MKTGTDELLKFKVLKNILQKPSYQVIGILEGIWLFTLKNAYLGDIGKYTDEEISFGIEYEGDQNSLISALVDTRWLDRDDTHRLIIHNWKEHIPQYLRRKAERNKEEFPIANHITPCLDMTNHSLATASQKIDMAPLVKPNLTYSNQTKPNQTKPKKNFCSEPENKTEDFLILTFPTVGDSKEWDLYNSKIQEYQESYPSLDISAQMKLALQWVKDNPAKRKTAKGMPKFLNSWLSRANDNPKTPRITPVNNQPTSHPSHDAGNEELSAEDEEVNDVLDWYNYVYHITFTRKNKPAQVEAIMDMLRSGYLGKEITFSLGIMADSDYWGQRGIPTFVDLDAQTGQHYLGKGRKRLAEKEQNHREAVAREIPERIQFFKMKEKDSKYMLQGKRKGAINLWYYFNMPEWEYYRDVKLYEEDFSPRAWEVYQKWVAFFKNRWDDPDRPSNLDELQNEEIKHHAEIQKAKWEQEKKAKEWHDGELPADFRYTGLAAEEEEYYQEEPAIAANQAVEAAG